MMMNFKKVAGAGIAAVTFSLMAGTAMAAPSFNAGTAVVFATQGIPANGNVTINSANAPVVTTDTLTAAGSFLITYTLPTGVTFATAPTLALGGAGYTGSAVLSGGGTGSNTATFTVTITAVGVVPATLTLGAFQLTGATVLSSVTAASAFQMSEQISASTVAPSENQTAPLKASLASSATNLAIASTANTIGGTLVIDVTAPSNGTKFKQNGGTAGLVADLGSVNTTALTNSNSTNTGAYTFTSTTDTLTLGGNTQGIAAAYLAAAGTTTCATTAATQATTGIAGTITGTTITFPGIPIATGTREICLYASGTGLIGSNSLGFTATASIDTTSVGLVAPYNLSTYTYNGTATTVNYATNYANSYADYVRIVNGTSASQVITAVVTNDAGATGFTTVETGLAAGNNDLVPVTSIVTNAGITSATTRYAITFFTTAQSGVTVENLLVNPGGVITQLN
jgi:hypothetical protein